MTDIEKIKQEIDKVSDSLAEKLNKATLEAKESGKISSELKDDLAKLTDEHNEKFEAMNKSFEEKQKHLDELDVKFQKAGEDRSKSEPWQSPLQKSMEDVLKEKGHVQGTFELKADILESSALTNDVIPYDRVRADIVSPLERDRHIRPHLMQGSTDKDKVDFVEETAITDSTDNIAEGAAFAQSDISLTQQTSNVRKIGTYVTLSKEILEDIPGLMSYVQGRLLSKYRQYEDTQFLSGPGTGQDLSGLITTATAWADPGAAFTDTGATNWDVLRHAIRQGTVAEYMSDKIFVNPTDLAAMDLEKDSQGRYILPNIFSGAEHKVSGVVVIPTTAIAVDNFLVGDFKQGAQIFDRRQVSLEVAYNNEDDFIKDLVSMKLTSRVALVKYRPGVFITGTFSGSKTLLAT